MTLQDLITLPHTDSALTSLSFIIVRGWTFLIVSFVVFCYFVAHRRTPMRAASIFPVLTDSLGKSAIALIIVIVILNFTEGVFELAFLLAFFAAHLIIGALILPLSILLSKRLPGAVIINVIACTSAIALAVAEPGLHADFS